MGSPFTIHIWTIGTLANRCGPTRLNPEIHNRRGAVGGVLVEETDSREALHGLCLWLRCSNDSTHNDWTRDPRDEKAVVLQVSSGTCRCFSASVAKITGKTAEGRGGSILTDAKEGQYWLEVLWQTATPIAHPLTGHSLRDTAISLFVETRCRKLWAGERESQNGGG